MVSVEMKNNDGVRRLTPTYVVVAWIVFTLFGPVAFAAAAEKMTEAAKAEKVKRILEGKVMNPRLINQGNSVFCNSFLEDFRAQRGIEFVEPVTRADDYDDPALKPYRERCPKLKMNKTGIIEPRWLDEIERLGQTPEEVLDDLDSGGRAHIATANFKMFEVDIDNNAQNGKEHVFYAEGFFNSVLAKSPYSHGWLDGGYSVIDFKECRTRDGANSHDPYDYDQHRPLENYSGIIRYRDRHYIFDLYDFYPVELGRYYSLTLEGYSKVMSKVIPMCSFINNVK